MSVLETCDNGAEQVPPAPRLDEGTKLVGEVWAVKWWPDAGEAVAFIGRSAWTREERADIEADEVSLDPRAIARRKIENRDRAVRRARSSVRRYVVANSLTRMLTLTFAPTTPFTCGPIASVGADGSESRPPGGAERLDPVSADPPSAHEGLCRCGRPRGPAGLIYAMEQAASFVRVLRDRCNEGQPHPYAMVPEYHQDGHVHVHLLLPFFVAKIVAANLWDRGWVDLRKFRAMGGGREAARKAAHYASKYVGKTFDAEGQSGRHRYEVGEGFQPKSVKRAGFTSSADAISYVLDHGQAVVYALASDELGEDYDGPPWLWVVLERVASA